jgi:hypothetical protein
MKLSIKMDIINHEMYSLRTLLQVIDHREKHNYTTIIDQ